MPPWTPKPQLIGKYGMSTGMSKDIHLPHSDSLTCTWNMDENGPVENKSPLQTAGLSTSMLVNWSLNKRTSTTQTYVSSSHFWNLSNFVALKPDHFNTLAALLGRCCGYQPLPNPWFLLICHRAATRIAQRRVAGRRSKSRAASAGPWEQSTGGASGGASEHRPKRNTCCGKNAYNIIYIYIYVCIHL